MRVVDERDLFRLGREEALKVLEEVDYVMIPGAWFVPAEVYRERLRDEA
ncbi:hypothetical protein [Thermococcus barophilus]|uniref:Uncharacterized protein n=1 Tax=Thermococcus barophilus TaxID=55802 RepID=A0A0S1XEK1_THEBA|nr:hypothetical protein [Thermococcus barophilus]ALM76233.1 hypothetical protein TBCH5v1_2338 [Thermococcus barophilus]